MAMATSELEYHAAGLGSPCRPTSYLDSIRSISSPYLSDWDLLPWKRVLLVSPTSSSCSSFTASTVSSPSPFCSPSSSAANCALEAYELLEVAHRMVRDGYVQEMIQSSASPKDDALVERWFSELDVDWVLRIDQGSLQELDLISLHELVQRWTRALFLVVQVLRSEQLQLRDRSSAATVAGGKTKATTSSWLTTWLAKIGALRSTARGKLQHEIQLARLAGASITRMLPFVDALAAVASADRAPTNLPGMLQMYASIADACPGVLALFREASSRQPPVGDVFDEMHGVFERKRKALSQVIWTMMEEAKASFLTTDGDSRSWPDIPASQVVLAGGSVHKTTQKVMHYVRLLWNNDGAVSSILQDHHFGKFVSEAEGLSSLVNLIADTVSCLQDRLSQESAAVADGGLRYMFLLNNSHFIAQRVESLDLPSWAPFDYRTERYVKSYLDTSWAPVLDRLYDDKHFFAERYSSLAKFESEFQRIYTAQKFWKVPSPELRKRLRKAIVDRIVTGYRKYLEDLRKHGKSITISITGRRTPQDLEELIAELFEG